MIQNHHSQIRYITTISHEGKTVDHLHTIFFFARVVATNNYLNTGTISNMHTITLHSKTNKINNASYVCVKDEHSGLGSIPGLPHYA